MFPRKLGFGLMRLPLNHPQDFTDVDLDTLTRMVDLFLARGFSYFDTAYLYPASEESIRKTLVERYPRERFFLTDKLPVSIAETTADMDRIFGEQLQRCGVDHFDLYLLHALDASMYEKARGLGAFDFLQRKKADGTAENIGLSFHDKADVLDGILAAHPEVDFVQLQINYLDWDDESVQSRKCLAVARKHSKPVIVMEPARGGSLANVPADVESLFQRHAPGMSAASWAIRYAAGLEGVAMVLSGMSNLAQMTDNTGYMTDFKPLTAAEIAIVRDAAAYIAAHIAVPCTACRYCVAGCPKNIPIPEYFNLYNSLKRSAPAPYHVEQFYYGTLTKIFGKASDCVACGQCEKRCPQHLPIIDGLKDTAVAMEVAGPV